MKEYFNFDQRLGIDLPKLEKDLDYYPIKIQQGILFHWEKIRGWIPDRIAELEQFINKKQAQLSDEEDFTRSCELNSEIAELASMINDLWIWYRVNPTISCH